MTTRITLRSNIASIQAQRRLGSSTEALRDTFTQLSSGLRINKVSDDAAGLAIASQLSVDARVYAVGVRNINDGISMLQIADAAVAELSTIVDRISELAQQSANGVYSSEQRQNLDREAQALANEYDRIVATTDFNGISILDSENEVFRIQAGYGEEAGLDIDLSGLTTRLVGDGTFSFSASYAASGTYRHVDAADFNNDGNLDFVQSIINSDQIQVFLGNGDGSFQSIIGSSSPDTTNPSYIDVGDIDGDGFVDVATSQGTTMGILLGNGDGRFDARVYYDAPTSMGGIRLSDFNGDGNLDAVSVSPSGELYMFQGNGDGSFLAPTSYSTLSQNNSIAVADVNNDGIEDVIATGNSNRLNIFLGNSDGTFGAVISRSGLDVGGSNGEDRIETADFNGDGFIDVAYSTLDSDSLAIHLGHGDGSFGAAQSYSLGASSSWLSQGDINGDGEVDLIADVSGVGSYIFLGNGDGTFSYGTSFSSGGRIVLADYTSDGVLDTVSGGTIIQVFEGNAEETGGIPVFNLNTAAKSLEALEIMKEVRNDFSAFRARIGAFESRLTTALSNLNVSIENFRAAESRITDADFARQSAELVKFQILQQAGIAVLGQANLSPSLALDLLT